WPPTCSRWRRRRWGSPLLFTRGVVFHRGPAALHGGDRVALRRLGGRRPVAIPRRHALRDGGLLVLNIRRRRRRRRRVRETRPPRARAGGDGGGAMGPRSDADVRPGGRKRR
ncbi:unnamed protein product, partial [Ectocarpus sp. 8 AP-2014]